ncbi:hypothetical protein [Raoultibacter phocaeensis]|uniref:hypothetical protein n=1 Tax=Raoultibacter phocaeensis TaxID=2479841 RepID=UPI001117DD31|nr:hypothetical protein [Raoultibacter phocaeensis]
MRKSNVIITALIVAASAFLLFLWVYMGFYRVDTPLDLVLSIAWWVIVAAAVVVIAKSEKTRRERIRRIYIGANALFNSEAGLVEYTVERSGTDQLAVLVGGILDNLNYGFEKKDVPTADEFVAAYYVQTDAYKDRGDTWRGSVVVPAADDSSEDERRAFADRQELLAELAALSPIAACRTVASVPASEPHLAGA